jgi:hypothetical protein
MPLTDVAIRNAKPRDKPYKVGGTLGLFLLVQPSGGKLWRVKYRIDGKEKKLANSRGDHRYARNGQHPDNAPVPGASPARTCG